MISMSALKHLILLLSLLWSLMEVHSQTEYPYVSLMGEILPNHAYVDLTTVGDDNSDPGNTLNCHSDLVTCCHRDQGPHRGDWYFPDNTVLGFLFFNPDDNIRQLRSAQQVEIHHRNIGTAPTGIYRCSIETNSVNRDIEGNRVRERVYIGLYTSAGNSTLLYS